MNLAAPQNETPLSTVQAIEWLVKKEQDGEILLDPRAKHTFTRYIETEKQFPARMGL